MLSGFFFFYTGLFHWVLVVDPPRFVTSLPIAPSLWVPFFPHLMKFRGVFRHFS